MRDHGQSPLLATSTDHEPLPTGQHHALRPRRPLDGRPPAELDAGLLEEEGVGEPSARCGGAARLGARLRAGPALHAVRGRGRREGPDFVPRPGQAASGRGAGRVPGRPEGVLFARLRGLAGRPDPPSRLRVRRRRGVGEAQRDRSPSLRRRRHRLGLPGPRVCPPAQVGPVRRDRPQPGGPGDRPGECRQARAARPRRVRRGGPPRARGGGAAVRPDRVESALHRDRRHPDPRGRRPRLRAPPRARRRRGRGSASSTG